MVFLNSCPFAEVLAVNLSMDIFRSYNTKRKSLHVAFVQKYANFVIVMCILFFCLIIYIKMLLDCDWLISVQLISNSSAKFRHDVR
jgi:hypothetical protein